MLFRQAQAICMMIICTMASCKTTDDQSEAFSVPSYEVYSDELVQSLITLSVECRVLIDYLATSLSSQKIATDKAVAMADELLLDKTAKLISQVNGAFNGLQDSATKSKEQKARFESLAQIQLDRVTGIASQLKSLMKPNQAQNCPNDKGQCEQAQQQIIVNAQQVPALAELAKEIGFLTETLINWRDEVISAQTDRVATEIAQGVYLANTDVGPCIVEVYPALGKSDQQNSSQLEGLDIVAIDSQWLSPSCQSLAFVCKGKVCTAKGQRLEASENANRFKMNGQIGFERMDVLRSPTARVSQQK